jgi:hypothetical protein
LRSDDAGLTWTAVAGEPRGDLLPAQAQLDHKEILYIAYSNSMGPWRHRRRGVQARYA